MGKKVKKAKEKDEIPEESSNDNQLQAILESVYLKMTNDHVSAELTHTEWAQVAGLLNQHSNEEDIRWKAVTKLFDIIHAKSGLVLYKEEISADDSEYT